MANVFSNYYNLIVMFVMKWSPVVFQKWKRIVLFNAILHLNDYWNKEFLRKTFNFIENIRIYGQWSVKLSWLIFQLIGNPFYAMISKDFEYLIFRGKLAFIAEHLPPKKSFSSVFANPLIFILQIFYCNHFKFTKLCWKFKLLKK